MGRKIGIDLGTTNTVVAIADGKQPRVLRNREGEEMTVSVVSVPRRGQAGELLVGTPAYRNWKTMPRDTVLSVKRLMGRGFEDEAVQKLRQRALYEIKSPDDGTPQSLRVVLGGREYSPIQVSAEILKKVKADAEARLDGEVVTHAVITVPAYFSEVQRRATRDAANLAGLQVIQILDEPTAAAIAFGLERPSEEPRTLLVYDFGGGTFDISILTWAGNVFVPMNLEGDMWLGGDDLDDVIIDMVAREVKASDGYDIRSNPALLVEVKQEARRLKELLSASDRGEMLVTTADVDIDVSITRRDFELAILPLVATFRRCACGQSNYCDAVTCHRCNASIGSLPVEDGRAISLVRKALQNASLTLGDIEYVLLAGNSTNVPIVRKALEPLFGAKIRSVSHPKLVVAQGAAIVAAQSGAEAADEVVHAHIAPFDYNLGLRSEQYFTFVRKSDPFPTPGDQRRAQLFHTQQANQPLVFCPVWGGDSKRPDALELQGNAYVRLPPNTPAGFPVEITVWLDQNGMFQLGAHAGNGVALQVLVDKGEEVQKAADALVAAEIVVESRKDEAMNADIDRLWDLRAQTLEQLFGGKAEQACRSAGRMHALAQEWGAVDGSLRERADHLVKFAVMLIDGFGWAFEPARIEQLRSGVRNVQASLAPGADAMLMMHYEMLNKACSDLPPIVMRILELHHVIVERIEPRSPARAQAFKKELSALLPRLAIGDESALTQLGDLAGSVAKASNDLGPDVREAPRECATCSGPIQPGARFCDAGHDSWLLRGGASSFSGGVAR